MSARRIVWEIAAAVGVLAALGLASQLLPSRSARDLKAEAAAVFARYPAQDSNASAAEIEKLASALGIRLGKDPVSPLSEKAFQEIKTPLKDYVDTQISTATDEINPMPDALHFYLENNRKTIRAIIETAKSAPPEWEINLEKGVEAPGPNFRALWDLQRLLILDCMDGIATADPTAEERLAAAFEMNERMGKRPETISHIFAAAIAKLHLGVLRKMLSASPEWHKRLQGLDYRKRSAESLLLEAWLLDQYGIPSMTLPGRVALRFGMADYWEKTELLLEEFKKADPCNFPAEAIDADPNLRPSSWSVASGFWYDKAESYARILRLLLDAELTDKILLAKAERARRNSPSESIPGISESVCKDGKWSYVFSGDGKLELSFNKVLKPASRGLDLPLSYSDAGGKGRGLE